MVFITPKSGAKDTVFCFLFICVFFFSSLALKKGVPFFCQSLIRDCNTSAVGPTKLHLSFWICLVKGIHCHHLSGCRVEISCVFSMKLGQDGRQLAANPYYWDFERMLPSRQQSKGSALIPTLDALINSSTSDAWLWPKDLTRKPMLMGSREKPSSAMMLKTCWAPVKW